jgi:hypothetical protein
MSSGTTNKVLIDLVARMEAQSSRINVSELFRYDRNGVRAAIAALQDETAEVLAVWRLNKRYLKSRPAIEAIRHEFLDVAAVAMLAYQETFNETSSEFSSLTDD